MRVAMMMLAAVAAPLACSGPAQPGTTDTLPTAAAVATVSISPPSISLQLGKTLQLNATARDAAGNALANRVPVWSSTDSTIAQVSSSGLLAARTVGTATIRVAVEGKSATAPMVVVAVPVASVAVAPATPSVQVGGTVQFSATARDAAGNTLSGRTISWSSSNVGIATVTPGGRASALAVGTANIVAISEGVSGQATLTVTATPPPPPPPVASATVTLGASALTVGQTTQASAVLKDASGNVLTGRTITWASSNTSTATVNGAGVVTATAAGSASISATSEGIKGQAALTVSAAPPPPPAPVATVTVTLGASALTVGQTTQASVVLKDANGTVLTGRTVSWASSNTSVATVSGSGLVTAAAAGGANITATSEGKSGSAGVTVTTPSTTKVDTIFAENFESGTLAVWDDGVDPTRHRVVTDATVAHSGQRALEVSYPANDTGGWLTKFFMPGYDSLFVRMYVRLAPDWVGGGKLLLLRGSRTDNQWSAFGVAGKCPVGTDFFATNIMMEDNGNPGTLTFYTYFPEMTREPDGVTCWGRYGDGTNEHYFPPLAMARGSWQRLEFWVKLNTPGQHDGIQRFWLNGVLRGEWPNLSYRTSTILRLNSMSLELSSPTASVSRKLWIDDIVVTRAPVAP